MMLTEFSYALRRFRGQILGWGIALAIYGGFLVTFYPTLAENREQFQALLEAYPPALMAFFGESLDIFSPDGFLDLYFFSYMSVVVGIFAVGAGSSLVIGDEEKGILDLLMAHPISRTSLFWGRCLAMLVAMMLILALFYIAIMLGITTVPELEIGWGEMVLPAISLLALLSFFSALSLVLSTLLPSRRMASMATGIILVASYFITSLGRSFEELETAARFSPMSYYQGGMAVNGLNGEWLLGLLAGAALFLLVAWWRFQGRDIRVTGEGGWSFSLPSLRRKLGE